ncbi:MAG: hypothetical protein HRU04_06885 [Oceanospirillaceae bacterium]|nr:hypothetical protein [Oceanospirillaceae bacterium]
MDKNISISHVLTTMTILIAGIFFIAGQDTRIAENAKDIEYNKASIAEQETRVNRTLDSINRKLDKLTDLALQKR